MKYEDILHKINGYGKYQKIVVFLLVLSTIPNGLFTMVTVFILDTPAHHCKIDAPDYNQTLTEQYDEQSPTLRSYIPLEKTEDGEWKLSECKKFLNASVNATNSNGTIVCDSGWTYYALWGEVTAVMEWDLVCSNTWMKPLVTSVYMAGVLFGSAFSGALSDRYGRRPIFLWGTLLQFVSMFANGFCEDAILFTITMFFAGCTQLINYVTAFVVATELVDSSKRALVGSLEIGGFTIGYMLLPACAYFITDWQWLMRFMGLIGFLFIPYYWWIPESPRWLIMNGKTEEAEKLISRIAKRNGKELNDEDLTALQKVDVEDDGEIKEQFTYLDLLRHPSIRLRSLVMFVVWFTTSMTYYCISLGTSNLGGNKFFNCFVASGVEIPAYLSSYFLMQKVGRRFTLSSYLIIGGIACAAAPFFLPFSRDLMIASSMVSKFSVTGVFSVIYIVCCEIFPTKMRNMSVGASSTMARVGAIAAPYLIFAGESISRYFPYIFMGAFAILSGLLTLLLPETVRASLPETLEDSVKLDKYNLSPCRKQHDDDRDSTTEDVQEKESIRA